MKEEREVGIESVARNVPQVELDFGEEERELARGLHSWCWDVTEWKDVNFGFVGNKTEEEERTQGMRRSGRGGGCVRGSESVLWFSDEYPGTCRGVMRTRSELLPG